MTGQSFQNIKTLGRFFYPLYHVIPYTTYTLHQTPLDSMLGAHSPRHLSNMCKISACDCVLKQVVVWQWQGLDMCMAIGDDPCSKAGIIPPQAITMGTVTRHVSKPMLLTVGNPKKSHVGSDLKSMVHAPPGYVLWAQTLIRRSF